MSDYRIVEKKDNRFIVQGLTDGIDSDDPWEEYDSREWVTLREFATLKEAKACKRDLDLEEGIIHE
jgi:hypothetical protein